MWRHVCFLLKINKCKSTDVLRVRSYIAAVQAYLLQLCAWNSKLLHVC